MCNCAKNFNVRVARPTDYKSFKRILDIGKHPAFIGKDTMMRHADNGGALFFEFESDPIAVSLTNPHHGVLLALNVIPAHRSHGLGCSIINYLMPNFVRALESRIGLFEKMGYISVGKSKKGICLNTQLMARKALFGLAGRLQRLDGITADKQKRT